MMINGYGVQSWTMWVFGGLMMIGVLVLIGLLAWAIVVAARRTQPGQAAMEHVMAEAGARGRNRQILDERYARGEMTTDDYTERLHTLAL